MILILAEQKKGKIQKGTFETFEAARRLREQWKTPCAALLIGGSDEGEAQKLGQALLNSPGHLTIVPAAPATGCHVHAAIGCYSLIVCPRTPGQPYRPLVLASRAEAEALADELRRYLCPPADGDQELYTNMSQFEGMSDASAKRR